MAFLGIFKTKKDFTEQLPPGGLRAPIWKLEKRENHNNMGYHIHISKLQSGKYVRTNAALTLKNEEVVLFFHNDGARVNISEKDITTSFKVELKDQLNDQIKNIPSNAWRPITKDKYIFMFNK